MSSPPWSRISGTSTFLLFLPEGGALDFADKTSLSKVTHQVTERFDDVVAG